MDFYSFIMLQSDDSTSISSLECDSSNESDRGGNANVKSCFEPYQVMCNLQ